MNKSQTINDKFKHINNILKKINEKAFSQRLLKTTHFFSKCRENVAKGGSVVVP